MLFFGVECLCCMGCSYFYGLFVWLKLCIFIVGIVLVLILWNVFMVGCMVVVWCECGCMGGWWCGMCVLGVKDSVMWWEN